MNEKATVEAEEQKWDGKCLICEKPVEPADFYPSSARDCINGAVVGDYMEIYGNRTCLRDMRKFVVIPNRMRLWEWKKP